MQIVYYILKDISFKQLSRKIKILNLVFLIQIFS